MNTPETYLIEPYNCYAPKQKKKHWMQEVEEQNLLASIVAEQVALQEAAANKNATLAPQMPPQAMPPIVPIPPAGGGSQPRPQFFHPQATYAFTATPNTSSAPTTVQVSVTGGEDVFALGGAYVNWNWGDGTTGTGAGNFHTYTSTGSFNIIMSVSASIDDSNLGTQTSQVTMSVPTVTSAFTLSGATVILTASFYTASVGDTITFINGATTNNPSNALTYNWTFGSGSAASSSLTNPTFTYSTASSYSVTLGVSGSFNAIATGTRNIKIV